MAVRNQRKIKNTSASMAEQLEELIQPNPTRRTRAKPIDRTVEEKREETVMKKEKMSQEEIVQSLLNDPEFDEVLTVMSKEIIETHPNFKPDFEALKAKTPEVLGEVITRLEAKGESITHENIIPVFVVSMMAVLAEQAAATSAPDAVPTAEEEQAEQTTAPTAVVVSASDASVEQPAEEALQGVVEETKPEGLVFMKRKLHEKEPNRAIQAMRRVVGV